MNTRDFDEAQITVYHGRQRKKI